MYGIENIGYWIPKDNPNNTLVYIIAYPGRLEQESMWMNFLNDPEWKAAYLASTANGKLVNKVERVFMNATDYSMPVTKILSDPDRAGVLLNRLRDKARNLSHEIDNYTAVAGSAGSWFKVRGVIEEVLDEDDDESLV